MDCALLIKFIFKLKIYNNLASFWNGSFKSIYEKKVIKKVDEMEV
jgi:hypothetical protein